MWEESFFGVEGNAEKQKWIAFIAKGDIGQCRVFGNECISKVAVTF